MATGGDDFQSALIGNFMTVTGADAERASFFLQSAAWNLQTAIDAFYDTGVGHGGEEEGGIHEGVPVEETRPPSPGPAIAGTIHPLASKPAGKTTSGSGVATLSDYREQQQSGGSSKGDDEDAQQFYAGGSEHSGQMIEGPPRKKANPQEIAKEVFEAAKKHGAVDLEEEERKRKQEERSAAFQGSGFRLGDSEGPSTAVAGAQRTKPAEKVYRTLTFWRDGFSIDDGPLRTGDSDEDKRFIESVSKGEIPQELLSAARGGEVDINIQDKRTEAYTKPKPKLVAFSGHGQKLGSFAPEVVSHSSPSPVATSGGVAGSSVDLAPPTVPLDPTQPTTSVQIRLADGTRLVSKFNHTHTVNDIRQFINILALPPLSSRPSMSSVNYILMTTFPNKELSEPTQTLQQANLLNAVIVQRIK